MDSSLTLAFFREIGLIKKTANWEGLTDHEKGFLEWVSDNKTMFQMGDLQVAYQKSITEGALMLQNWNVEYLNSSNAFVVKQETEIKQQPASSSFVSSTECKQLEGEYIQADADVAIESPVEEVQEVGVRKGMAFPDDLLYTYRTPATHELMPRSFFGLTIFTTKPGTSLEQIDGRNFEHIYATLKTRLNKPELIGVTLDPVFDARLFRIIIKQIKGLKQNQFELRRHGQVVQQGQLLAVDYVELFKEAGYSDSSLKSPEFKKRVSIACKRIGQFKMGYVVYEEGEEIHKFDPFFGHLEFNLTTKKIEFIGTNILFEIFRDDKVLNLHSSALLLADGKIENTLLLYIVSLPRHHHKFKRDKMLTAPIQITTLVMRCYPDVPELELLGDRDKLRLVRDAMARMKKKGLLDYELIGRGRKTIYNSVVHYCELDETEFKARFNEEEPQVQSPTTLLTYFENNTFPRRASNEKILEFGQKHIPRIFALIKSDTDEALVVSFAGVVKPRILLLKKYAEKLQHPELLEAVNRILQIRSKPKK